MCVCVPESHRIENRRARIYWAHTRTHLHTCSHRLVFTFRIISHVRALRTWGAHSSQMGIKSKFTSPQQQQQQQLIRCPFFTECTVTLLKNRPTMPFLEIIVALQWQHDINRDSVCVCVEVRVSVYACHE